MEKPVTSVDDYENRLFLETLSRMPRGYHGVCGFHFKDNVLKKQFISVYRMESFPPGFKKSVSVHSCVHRKNYSEFSVPSLLGNVEDDLDL